MLKVIQQLGLQDARAINLRACPLSTACTKIILVEFVFMIRQLLDVSATNSSGADPGFH